MNLKLRFVWVWLCLAAFPLLNACGDDHFYFVPMGARPIDTPLISLNPHSTPTPTPTPSPTPTPVPGSASLSYLPNDLAVTPSGQSMIVGTKGDGSTVAETWATCLHADLSPLRSDFRIFQEAGTSDSLYVYNPIVSISRNGEHAAVLFPLRRGAYPALGPYSIAFFDRACQQVGATLELGRYGGDPYYDMSMDDQGRVAVVKTTRLGNTDTKASQLDLFSAQGVWTASLDTTACSSLPSGTHVALNKQTGEGVMSCQGGYDEPVKFRRFNINGQWLDSDFQIIAESSNGHSGMSDTHAIGMFDDGRFAIAWIDSNLPATNPMISLYHLDFYSPSGQKLETHMFFSSNYDGHQGFGLFHPAILQPLGSGFLMPFAVRGDLTGMIRLDANGQWLATALSSEIDTIVFPSAWNGRFLLQTLRSTSTGDYYFLELNHQRVRKNIPLGSAFVPVLNR